MNLRDIYRPISRELEIVEERLYNLSRSDSETISKAISEVLTAGGKRLRPALLLTAAKACGFTGDRCINLATVVELIHTASLIHDDVIDNADLRREVPTINSRWGNRVSVLAGDHLYSRVVGILTEDGDREMTHAVMTAVGSMTSSEVAAIPYQNQVNMTEEKYLSLISGKTASLMSCCCRLGAMLSESRNGNVAALSDYGLNLGMAFQITDDLLDLMDDENALGKSSGNDIREGKMTLPFIYAVGVLKGKDRKWMEDVFKTGQIDGDGLVRMRDIVKMCGGIDYSLKKARDYGRLCKKKLETLAKTAYRDSLASFVDCVVGRFGGNGQLSGIGGT